MHFIIKLFPEITLKSSSVRKRLTRQLTRNVHTLLTRIDPEAKVHEEWDYLYAQLTEGYFNAEVVQQLQRIPGIANFSAVHTYTLASLEDVLEKTLRHWGKQIADKSFCVRVKRNGQHTFSSTEVERFVGAGLLQHSPTAKVKLKQPDITVPLEIRGDKLFIISKQHPGLGGFPVATQHPVLSLISGGFDSTVASYLAIKRGLKTHFCFFNLGGREHELGVQETAYYIWHRYSASHRVKFISVPFEAVVAEILATIDRSYRGVVLKRMMLRAASQIADATGIKALVTGEAIAQVSSQTLPNLHIIDRVTDKLIIRPLITMDKGDIIALSRQIGTEEFAAHMPEYCGVISSRPSADAKLSRVEQQETQFDLELLEQAIASATVQSIDQLCHTSNSSSAPILITMPTADDIILDIRHPEEIASKPLQIPYATVCEIPFYSLSQDYEKLDRDKRYLLYCDKGVMSQLHAAHLKDQGFDNIAVYRPEP